MVEINNVYSSVPKETLLSEDETIEHRRPILKFLKEQKGKFFTAREIAKICDFPVGGTQVAVRKAITLLLEMDNEPIMSNAYGFSYVTKPEQMDFYADKLSERLKGLKRRIDSVRKVADNMRCKDWLN